MRQLAVAMKKSVLVILSTGLAACASDASVASDLPYASWSLGFVAPNHMEVWIEAAEVEDVRGRLFAKLETGTAAIDYRGEAAGWVKRMGIPGRMVTGASYPKRIYVRWQSLVEPQTYHAYIDIPERARQLMLTKTKHRVLPEEYYKDAIVVGLAPGGWLKVWVNGAAGEPAEVVCQRAQVEPKGPYDGLSGGKYRPLSEYALPYVQSHPIPYGSWNCGR